MSRLVARLGVVVGLVVAGLVGCGSGDTTADGPTATLGTAPPVTDPYAVPEVIDEAYVNRVLAGLDQAVGDVVRLVVNTRTIPPEAVDRLKALYIGEFLQLKVDVIQEDLSRRLAGLPGYKPMPGNKRTTVTELITARPSCIFAQVARDLSDVSAEPDPRLNTQWVAIVPLDPAIDPNHFNRMSWAYIYDGFPPDRTRPEDPCASVP